MIHRRPFLLPGIVFLLSTALYAPLVGRYFVSEDFLILRRLTENPWWSTVVAQWTGPWLETTAVLFYRPVASMILLGEVAVLGFHPHLLVLLQVLVHGVCALLVFGIARRLLPEEGPPWGAFGAATLFALYPLHPNTVVWIAAFVNLYGAAFALACVWLYLHRRWVPSFACFALALGCYEGVAVLPLLVVGCDWTLTAEQDRGSWRERPVQWARWAPFFALLVGYLLLRGWALGSVVGGYPQTRGRLLEAPLEVLGAAVASPLRTLLPLTPELPLWPALLGSLALIALAAWTRNRVALLGLAWTVIAQAPFGFVEIVPGRGRFRYLAAVGVALAVVALLRSVRSPQPGRPRLPIAVGGSVVAAGWLVLLLPNLMHYAEAGRLSRKVQEEVLRATATVAEGTPVFVTRYPRYVRTPGGAEAAHIFSWGLRDAIHPPFTDRAIDLYPLPPLGDGALLAVAESQPQAQILIWDREAETLRPFHITPAIRAATAKIRRYEAGLEDGEIVLPPGAPAPTVLLLAGPGNPQRVEVAATPDAQGRLRIPLPTAFLEAQAQLYGEEVYWWLETRGTEGQLLGFTPALPMPDAGGQIRQ